MSSILIAKHNIRRTLGNRKGLILLVLLPILVISAIIGYFGRASDDRVQIAVWNEDQSFLSAPLLESIQSVDAYFLNVQDPQTTTLEKLKDEVYMGKWGAAIHIPEDFTDKLLAGEETKVSLFRKNEQQWNTSLKITLTDASDRLGRYVQMASKSSADHLNQGELVRQLLGQQALSKVEVINQKLVLPYNNAIVLVTGLMLMFVMILVNQSIHGIMEDRSNRTMARVFAAPVRAWEIALGNFLGCLLLGTIQLVLILAVTRYVMGFDFGLSFGQILMIMECFLLAAVGIASAVAGLVKNSSSLGNINNLVVIPTCMLGGCFWPVTMMPDFMQKLSNFTPQRWAIAAMEQVQSGASLPAIGMELGVLILFAAVLLAYGSYILQPDKN